MDHKQYARAVYGNTHTILTGAIGFACLVGFWAFVAIGISLTIKSIFDVFVENMYILVRIVFTMGAGFLACGFILRWTARLVLRSSLWGLVIAFLIAGSCAILLCLAMIYPIWSNAAEAFTVSMALVASLCWMVVILIAAITRHKSPSA
jgi:hypothetical protein